MLGISHFDDEKWPGLQAADMGASMVKDVFAASRSRRPVLEEEFPLRSRFEHIGHCDETYHLSMLEAQSIRESEARTHDGKRHI
jgi:hypothetical protein